MLTIRIAPPVMFAALLVVLSGCSSAEPATGKAGEAVQGQPEPYGYEFDVDRLGANVTPVTTNTPISAPAAGVRMPPETIQAVVRAGAGPIAACHQTALAAQPGLAGDLALHFTVDPSGAPQGTRVERSTLPDGALGACVVAAFGALRFPASSAGLLTVVYPLHFEP